MGLFNGFLKEGPGVPKDLPEKNRFFLFFELFFRKIGKLVGLNMLMAVCLIPMALGIFLSVQINPVVLNQQSAQSASILNNALFVPTGDLMGLIIYIISIFITYPAISGFTYVIRNFQRGEHAWVLSDFKDNFISNFKQSVAVGIIDAIVYMVLYVAFVFYSSDIPNMGAVFSAISPVLAIIVAMLAFVYTWMHYYIFVMIVTFELSIKDIMKNALIFAISKLFTNIFITIICGAIILANIMYLGFGIVLAFFITISLIGYIVVFTIYPTIDKYLLTPVMNSSENADENSDFNDIEEA